MPVAFVPQRYAARVSEVSTPYPAARRIRLSGGDLAEWRSSATADEWIHLELPGEPSRLYSVRSHDPRTAELEVEISLRSTGPAGRWALKARAGDRLIISQPAGRYRPPADTRWLLVIADHAGFPAACRILAEVPTGLAAQAIFSAELRSAADELPDGVEVSWAGDVAVAAGPALSSSEPGYLWMGAEAGQARAVRRRLRAHGWSPDRFAVAGYWQRRDLDYERRYRAVEQQIAALYDELEAATRDPEAIAADLDDLLDAHNL